FGAGADPLSLGLSSNAGRGEPRTTDTARFGAPMDGVLGRVHTPEHDEPPLPLPRSQHDFSSAAPLAPAIGWGEGPGEMGPVPRPESSGLRTHRVAGAFLIVRGGALGLGGEGHAGHAHADLGSL